MSVVHLRASGTDQGIQKQQQSHQIIQYQEALLESRVFQKDGVPPTSRRFADGRSLQTYLKILLIPLADHGANCKPLLRITELATIL